MGRDGAASAHGSQSDRLCSQITIAMTRLARDHLGRGPVRAKTYIRDDLVVCVLSERMIPIERTMLESGARRQAVAIRREFQDVMKPRYASMVEEVTGARVVAVFSDADLEPDLVVIVFLLDRQLEPGRRPAPTPSGSSVAEPQSSSQV